MSDFLVWRSDWCSVFSEAQINIMMNIFTHEVSLFPVACCFYFCCVELIVQLLLLLLAFCVKSLVYCETASSLLSFPSRWSRRLTRGVAPQWQLHLSDSPVTAATAFRGRQGPRFCSGVRAHLKRKKQTAVRSASTQITENHRETQRNRTPVPRRFFSSVLIPPGPSAAVDTKTHPERCFLFVSSAEWTKDGAKQSHEKVESQWISFIKTCFSSSVDFTDIQRKHSPWRAAQRLHSQTEADGDASKPSPGFWGFNILKESRNEGWLWETLIKIKHTS